MFQQMQAMAQKQVTISFSLAPISFLRNFHWKNENQKKNIKKNAHTQTHTKQKWRKKNTIMFIWNILYKTFIMFIFCWCCCCVYVCACVFILFHHKQKPFIHWIASVCNICFNFFLYFELILVFFCVFILFWFSFIFFFFIYVFTLSISLFLYLFLSIFLNSESFRCEFSCNNNFYSLSLHRERKI